MAAIALSNMEAVEAIIGAGADVNAVDNEKCTVLEHAIVFRSVQNTKTLIDAKADVNFGRFPPLFMAIQKKHVEIVRVLVESNANVNATVAFMPMLHYAHQSGVPEIVSIVSRAYGEAILSGALDTKIREAFKPAKCVGTIRTSADSVANVQERLDHALLMGSHELFKEALNAGADPSLRGAFSFPLIAASMAGLADIAKDLIDAGVDITVTENGKTALQWAARRKHRDIVSMLLARVNELKKLN
jgi:ankyrin repeat protein